MSTRAAQRTNSRLRWLACALGQRSCTTSNRDPGPLGRIVWIALEIIPSNREHPPTLRSQASPSHLVTLAVHRQVMMRSAWLDHDPHRLVDDVEPVLPTVAPDVDVLSHRIDLGTREPCCNSILERGIRAVLPMDQIGTKRRTQPLRSRTRDPVMRDADEFVEVEYPPERRLRDQLHQFGLADVPGQGDDRPGDGQHPDTIDDLASRIEVAEHSQPYSLKPPTARRRRLHLDRTDATSTNPPERSGSMAREGRAVTRREDGGRPLAPLRQSRMAPAPDRRMSAVHLPPSVHSRDLRPRCATVQQLRRRDRSVLEGGNHCHLLSIEGHGTTITIDLSRKVRALQRRCANVVTKSAAVARLATYRERVVSRSVQHIAVPNGRCCRQSHRDRELSRPALHPATPIGTRTLPCRERVIRTARAPLGACRPDA